MSDGCLRDFADRARAAQAAIDALGAGPIHHDCARVERDAVDLHKALAEALRRQAQLAAAASTVGGLLDGYAWPSVGRGADMRVAIEEMRIALKSSLDSADLFDVLDRTSREHAP